MGQHRSTCNGGADSTHGHPQPKNFLRPCLLLLLGEEPAYGYQLREKLAPMSPRPWDMGTVYRTLNTMEEDGLVASSWERSAEGPRRRRYDITRAGMVVLDVLAEEMSGMRDLIAEFLDRYHDDLDGHALPEVEREHLAEPAGHPHAGNGRGPSPVREDREVGSLQLEA